MYRGEHYIKTLFPTVTELTVLLFAGIKLVAPDTPSPPDIDKQIIATAQTLRTFIQPMQLEGLRMVVKKFLAEGAKANIKRWVQTVEITACRAGLLLCGDLEIAKKIIAAEPQQLARRPDRAGEAQGAAPVLRLGAVLRAPHGAGDHHRGRRLASLRSGPAAHRQSS